LFLAKFVFITVAKKLRAAIKLWDKLFVIPDIGVTSTELAGY
jgi:hypothetical protein